MSDNKFDHWSFTIKYVKHESMSLPPEELRSKYEDILRRWAGKNIAVIYKKYEEDSKKRLHVHGIIETGKRLFFKGLLQKGYSMKFQLIYDAEGWKSYCNKKSFPLGSVKDISRSLFKRT